MNFDDTPDEAEFRAVAHAFLSKHLQPKDSNNARERGGDYLKRAKEWQKIKAAGGFAQITWPKQMGGRGGSASSRSESREAGGPVDALRTAGAERHRIPDRR